MLPFLDDSPLRSNDREPLGSKDFTHLTACGNEFPTSVFKFLVRFNK